MSYQLKVIKDHPVGFWPLDESSGTTATDISGCGNNGTYNGSPETDILPLVPGGVSGTRISNLDYISFPITKNFYGSSSDTGFATKYTSDNDFTLEVWVSQNITTTSETPLFADTTNNIGLFWEKSDVVFKASSSESVRWAVENPEKTIHIVGVYTGGSIKLYIDGEEVSTKILDNFKFTNTTLLLKSGPTLSINDSFIVDAPAVYRYSLPKMSVLKHFIDGNISCQPLHICYPEEGTLFSCTDARLKVNFEYAFGADNSWNEMIDSNTYYDEANEYITFFKTETVQSKELIIEKTFLIPTDIGLITSKIEWRNKIGISVYSRISETDPWEECANGRPLPQFKKGDFDNSGRVYIKVVMSTSDASKHLPRLSSLFIRFYSNNDVYADNYGDKITSLNNYYLGGTNYHVLAREYDNGIRPETNTGFNITTINDLRTIELFFTPTDISATTLVFDPLTSTTYGWNGSGAVSKASISKVYINGVDRTTEASISAFMVANQPHHIVLVLANTITGDIHFNYQMSGGGNSHLYNNIMLYEKPLSDSQILAHYNLYTSKPSSGVTESAITLTEIAPTFYNNDYIVVTFE